MFDAGGERERDREARLAEAPREPRIRCPRCRWQPDRSSLWSCRCGHAWNTFDTRGRCPACGHRWLETQCLSCHRWSAHDDWYTDD